MRDALVVIDVITDFATLTASCCSPRSASGSLRCCGRSRTRGARRAGGLRQRQPRRLDGRRRRVDRAHDRGGTGTRARRCRRAATGDGFLRKPRYSAFDNTALGIVLEELGVERVLLAGAATEMCIVQSAIDARELGLQGHDPGRRLRVRGRRGRGDRARLRRTGRRSVDRAGTGGAPRELSRVYGRPRGHVPLLSHVVPRRFR